MDRRQFLAGSAGCLALASRRVAAQHEQLPAETFDKACPIIDTNVYFFDWPFRPLKYSDPRRLYEKLKRHQVEKAWAGSFEAVWYKQLDAANRRLASDCRKYDGFFVPFGSVNPVGPDWREDLRRCQEEYQMPGIRLFPGYHGYRGDEREVAALFEEAADRGLLVQIVLKLEDERVHHPATRIGQPDLSAFATTLARFPQLRVQLLQSDAVLRHSALHALLELPNLVFDISSLEGQAGLRRLIDGNYGQGHSRIAVQKLLFGSHVPLFPVESALLKLFESSLSRDEAVAIMRENALRWSRV
ncbi:MAG: hypothetical protein KatS3mg110_3553 [Pirellulaceae bacterium]|nr:MAG: hypothetical protein KatS3mg110_3553 [Pirellulaceae bacterium]